MDQKQRDYSQEIRNGLQEVTQLIDYLDTQGLKDDIMWERWSVCDLIEMLEQADTPNLKTYAERHIYQHLPKILGMLLKKAKLHDELQNSHLT